MQIQDWAVVAAGACFVAYLIWPKFPLTAVGGILLCIAHFIAK